MFWVNCSGLIVVLGLFFNLNSVVRESRKNKGKEKERRKHEHQQPGALGTMRKTRETTGKAEGARTQREGNTRTTTTRGGNLKGKEKGET